jgi:hypothetical protein
VTSVGNASTLVNIPDVTTAAGSILFTDIAAPSSPSASHLKIFGDSTDLRFHDKNAAGTVGTTVVADTGASNNFLTAISAAGVISKSQPSFSNLSGNWTLAQGPSTTASALLGRTSAGAGIPQEITLGTNLSMSGQTLNATGSSGVTSIATTSPITGGTITTTGTLSLDVSVDHNFTTSQTMTVTDAVTSLETDALTLSHNSSGTPAANTYKTGLLFKGKSATVNDRIMGSVSGVWTTATDVSRDGYIFIQGANSSGLTGSGLYVFSNGSVNVNNNTKLGTNGVLSAAAYLISTSVGTAGTFLQSNGSTGYISSAYTLPSAIGAGGKILRSNGTNYIDTTATFPTTAGTSGNVLTSDGTNWTSAAVSTLSAATDSTAGVMSAADHTTLTGLSAATATGVAPAFVGVGVPCVGFKSGVDLKTNATTDIFTVPTSRSFVCTYAEVIPTSVTAGAAVAFVYFIKESGGSGQMTASTAAASAAPVTTKTWPQTGFTIGSGPYTMCAAANKVQITISTGFTTSTTVTGNVFVFGFYAQ